jgi:nucleotide-binding universal stress UspA family protein
MPVLQRVSVSVKNILVATDFSSVSDKAAAYAKALALNFRSRVEIAHVFDPSAVTSYLDGILGLPIRERMQLGAECLGRMAQDFADAGVEAVTLQPQGHRPHVTLLKLAAQDEVDLIVAGTHSKWGLERLIVGSTAEELIRNSTCPVLTVGPHARIPQPGPLVFKTIVYATDFSLRAAKAAVFALSFAQDSGAQIYFCHSIDKQCTPEEQHALDREFQAALHRMIPESVHEWCTPQAVVSHGHPAESILALAEKVNADLIVLGSRQASFWLTHIEHGITPDLLAEATCPVMTVC